MRIEIKKEPFDHIIIHDVLDDIQMQRVGNEIQFIEPRMKRVGEEGYIGGSAKDQHSGDYLKTNRGIFLNNTYNPQNNVSYLVEYMLQLCTSRELNSRAEELGFYFRLFCKVTRYYFLLQYYGDGDEYKSHRDNSTFTSILFLHKEPKNFTGGDFYFEEYDYTVTPENNKMIIFPSVIYHTVTPVKIIDPEIPLGGRFSLTIMQKTGDMPA